MYFKKRKYFVYFLHVQFRKRKKESKQQEVEQGVPVSVIMKQEILSCLVKFFLVRCFLRKNEKETGSSYLSQRLLGSLLEMCYSAIWGIFRSNNLAATRTLKKSTGLISKTILHVHHTFLYISSPFLHDYDVEMANLAFYKQRRNFISLSELGYRPLEFNFRKVRLHLTK